VIITVTLNAAIDKTLSVPNFRLGRRHRTVEQTTMAGGKGVNIARSLKSLDQPVIATGFAGGPTGTRIVEQLTAESILNDFVRIREESRTNTAVLDPTTGEQTEINERGPAVTAKELELFTDKLVYLARGAEIVVFAGSLPRGVEPDYYARSSASCASSGDRRSSTPTASRCASRAREPDVISPNVTRPRSSSGTSSTTTRTLLQAVRESGTLGAARGDHDHARRLLRQADIRRAGRCSCARASSRRAGRGVGSGGRLSSPGTWPRGTGGLLAEECLAFAWRAARTRSQPRRGDSSGRREVRAARHRRSRVARVTEGAAA
jgi:1-phosphofructokinase/tagatose 6-phosphate kinase